MGRVIRFIFFGNYFVGILAVALTLEATFQMGLPFTPTPIIKFLPNPQFQIPETNGTLSIKYLSVGARRFFLRFAYCWLLHYF